VCENKDKKENMRVYRYIHTWKHKSYNICFTTIPMIHIASKQFYEDVSSIINNCNLILEEGIPISIDSEIGSYTRIAKKVGLFAQINELRIESDITRLNIDIEKSELEIGLKSVSKKELLKFKCFKYLLLILSKQRLLEALYDLCAYPESSKALLIDPVNHYSYKHNKTPLDLLVTNTRDDCISKNLQEIIDVNINREYRFDLSKQ